MKKITTVKENTKSGNYTTTIRLCSTHSGFALFVSIGNLSNLHSLNVLVASSYAPPFCIRRMLIMGALTYTLFMAGIKLMH